MTDVHSHILFGVDDGSSSIEESITLLKGLKEVGFNNVILTPHYIEGSDYCSSRSNNLEKYNELKKIIKDKKIGINIYLGNEIFIDDDIIEYIKEGKISSLNDTKYLLIELPFHNKIVNLEDTLYELSYAGFVPILAHPERYDFFQKDYKMVDSLRENGVLFQANYASILGYYDNKSKKLLKYMLKKGYIDFLGTDIHRTKKMFVIDNFDKIEKKIVKIIGTDNYKKIISNCNKLV